MAHSLAASALLGLGCGEDPIVYAPCPSTVRQAIHGGVPEEGYLGLTELEQNAVLWLRARLTSRGPTAPCSGVLLGESSVLSAAHCVDPEGVSEIEVHLGSDGTNPELVRTAVEWEFHPELDAVLITLDEPVPGDVAVPLALGQTPQERLTGANAVIAGYGITETDQAGLRRFVTEPVVMVDDDLIVVDGKGETGACTGDSGGPALWREAASVVVIGVLHSGDPTCRGLDRYLSSSALESWVGERVSLGEAPADVDCPEAFAKGACFSSDTLAQAVWCDSGSLRGRTCDEGEVCGWDANVGGFGCGDPEAVTCVGGPEVR